MNLSNTIFNSVDGDLARLKMKILIVDDEPLNVALLEEILSEAGYTQVQSLTDSRQVFDTCKEFEPDLILLDLMMPNIDGFTVLESLRAYGSEIYLPIVVLTADVSDAAKRHALTSGATDFLRKPFDHVEVLLRIKNLLDSRRAHVQLVSNYIAALQDEPRFPTVVESRPAMMSEPRSYAVA